MSRLIPAAALVLVPVLVAAAVVTPQKRVQQKGPADFEATLSAARESWTAGKYGACMEQLKEATGLVMVKRIEVILAALPAAPEGFEKVENKRDQVKQNQLMAGMAAMVGNIIEQQYRGPFNVKVTVSADSPMVSMLSMGMNNPALMDKNSELIEYEGHKAILKTTRGGAGRELMIVISGKHLAQIDYASDNEDQLFVMWNQAAVDRLANALGN